MGRTQTIKALWDAEAEVWIATSTDVPGLVVEAPSWSSMIDEVRLVLPDLLEFAGRGSSGLSLFQAEERLDLTGS